MTDGDESSFPPGPGVDAAGRPVVDPTRNVLDLVAAAIQRQDDLREAESRHLREVQELRAEYDAKLATAETARIDAIRAVDVGNVQRAAEVAAAQAEALRATVATTATAAQTALSAALDPIQKDIADLRRAQYEAQGQKTQVVETQQRGTNMSVWIAIGISLFMVLLTMLSIGVTIIAIATHGFK